MTFEKNYFKPTEVVSLSKTFYEAVKGRYYVGQTDIICSNGLNIWGTLFNPHDSGVNIFVNVITFSNLGDNPFLGQLWINGDFPGKGIRSNKFTSTNTIPCLETIPKGEIIYSNGTCGFPQGGVNIYDRIVPIDTTLVGEEDGKFLIPPGGNFGVFVKAKARQDIKAIFAFGWWEESIKDCKD